jgi:FkbM family methyltransferase
MHGPCRCKDFKLGPSDVVIDVGAHIGSYTVRCAKAVGEKSLVIEFEPDYRASTIVAPPRENLSKQFKEI